MEKDFGKNFIITVFLSSVSLLSPTAYATNEQDDYAKAVEYTYQKVLDAYKKLNEKASFCRKKEIDASNIKGELPVIPDDETGRKMVMAIGYLSNHSYLRCTYPEEAGLVYQIHTYERLVSDANRERI